MILRLVIHNSYNMISRLQIEDANYSNTCQKKKRTQTGNYPHLAYLFIFYKINNIRLYMFKLYALVKVLKL